MTRLWPTTLTSQCWSLIIATVHGSGRIFHSKISSKLTEKGISSSYQVCSPLSGRNQNDVKEDC